MSLNQIAASRAEANGEAFVPVRCEPRERWSFMGRHIVEGQDCYLWKRYIEMPGTPEGFRAKGYAHPVATFWPAS